MNEASEAEEGRVRGGRKFSEEARVNALVLLAWSADVTHFPYGATANIACKLLCSLRAVQKLGCNSLTAKSHTILLNPKNWVISTPNAILG